jgi:ankyrin repeat protein
LLFFLNKLRGRLVDNRHLPLFIAAHAGNTEKVKALLQAGKIPFEIEDNLQNTALHRVAACKTPSAKSCAELLLTHAKLAGKIDQLDYTKETALSIAAYCGSPAIEPLLEAKPKSINAFDRRGYTALHNIAMSGVILTKEKIAFTQALLRAGADVNIESYYEHRTPLHCASGAGRDYPNNLETMVLLLQAGAKIHRVDQILHCLDVRIYQDYSDRRVYNILLQLQKACQKKITAAEKARYWAECTEPEIAEIQKMVQAQINERIEKLRQLYNYLSKKEQDFVSVVEVAARMPTEMAKIIYAYTGAAKFFKPFYYSSLD